jgi:hypothetical protein
MTVSGILSALFEDPHDPSTLQVFLPRNGDWTNAVHKSLPRDSHTSGEFDALIEIIAEINPLTWNGQILMRSLFSCNFSRLVHSCWIKGSYYSNVSSRSFHHERPIPILILSSFVSNASML